MQIVVLGMHRSGTSPLARILNMMGAYFSAEGKGMAAQVDNPKGFWERNDVMLLNDEILNTTHASWDRTLNWHPNSIEEQQQLLFKKQITSLVLDLDAHRPWMLKDPRMCLTFPLWRPHLECPLCIVAYRDPIRVARSLEKRNQLPIAVGLALWEYYTVSAIRSVQGLPWILSNYNDLLVYPSETVSKIYKWLKKLGATGLRHPSDIEIKSFLDPTLCHHHETDKDALAYLTVAQQELAKGLLQGTWLKPNLTLDELPKISQGAFETLKLHELHYANDDQEHFALLQGAQLQQPVVPCTTDNNVIKVNKIYDLSFQYAERNHKQAVKQLDQSRKDIITGYEKIDEQQGRLSEQEEEINIQNERILTQSKKIHEQYEFIQFQLKQIQTHDETISKQSEQIHAQQAQIQQYNDGLKLKNDQIYAKNKEILSQKEANRLQAAELLSQKEANRLQAAELLSQKEANRLQAAELLSQKEANRLQAAELLNQKEANRLQDEQLKLFTDWFIDLKQAIAAVFASARWRTGNYLIRIIEILLLRFQPNGAETYIDNILNKFETWRKRTNLNFQQETDYVSTNAPSRWQVFAPLAWAAIKHPLRTIQLITLTRIKNLYITLFYQPPEVRGSIIDYYLGIYNAELQQQDSDVAALNTENITAISAQIIFPETQQPLASIIIPVHNHFATTMDCLRSVVANTNNIDYEVIIADDCSWDQTIAIDAYAKNLRVIRTEENQGFLGNCNHAAKYVLGRYIVLLNNDTQVCPGWLTPLIELMEQNSLIGMTGPKLLFADRKLQEAGGIIWRDASGWNYGRGDDPEKPEYNYIKEVDYISGACLCIRRTIWEQLGGFDQRFRPAYYEDTDLAFAIRNLGYKVVYQPLSEVIHLEGISHGADTNQGIKKYQNINQDKFLEKWRYVLDRDHKENGTDIFHARDRSSHKKTMLMVDHYAPQYDRDAGSKSTFQYIKWLTECNIHLIFIGDNYARQEPYTKNLQQLGVEVLYGAWYASNWREWLKKHAEQIHYAYLHRPHIACKYIDEIRRVTNAKIIYFGHDLHYLRTQRQQEIEHNPALLVEAQNWQKQEFELFAKADIIYYPSVVEEAEVKQHFPTKIVRAIPLYVIDPVPEYPAQLSQRRDILFVGGFRHLPNVDAVDWFTTQVLPIIHKDIPDCRFIIVGSNMPLAIKNLASKKIEIHADVSEKELADWYDHTRVVVVPLRYGAGIKGKVLEAMKLQVPIVTTSIGAEGLLTPEHYLLLADDPQTFAAQVITALTNDTIWLNIRIQARLSLNQQFSKPKAKTILGQDIILH